MTHHTTGPRHTTATAALLVLTAQLAGCSGPDHQPEPQSASTTEPGIWNPCTIPDETLTHAGLDPTTEIPATPQRPDILLCNWRSDPAVWHHIVEITSTTIPLDTYKRLPTTGAYTDITIGGRTGIQYRPGDTTTQRRCDATFATTWGTITISTTTTGTPDDPCQRNTVTATTLSSGIPR
ncbi:DUF3558 family protein [Nocardia cyriacigeorgica]|uniref:DUF3558 domain-containing protein n=1 Tax=Nocardia cyriacigeorgica TaxID=135487 RepID=A0A5R8NAJ2_9NOCA|nr:DUF3558 family protein [Nocardia cyriacigeorgica]MBF6093982.1 DUF3558 family protein [Nocardia cyriacigeorgica]TLF72729.1 DUF3558 domain-containing protein [Nocardia cyriacigeorgica]TLF92381.1 DUF3558 domain-containing protein [Nocardia cyriacigeorgica]